jgi:hypothetical protein
MVAVMSGQLIYYQFSRSKVELGDFNHFLGLYRPDNLPDGRWLCDMMNNFVFGIEGWDDDPHEIPTIPQIRQFYSAFHDAWPYWLYFCNLDMATLRAMQRAGQPQAAVTCKPLDLLNFIKNDFMPMNLMCERAGMSENRIYDRTKAVFQYFGLPFDADLPEAKRY